MHDSRFLEISHLIPQYSNIQTNLSLYVVTNLSFIHSIYQTECRFKIVQGHLLILLIVSTIRRLSLNLIAISKLTANIYKYHRIFIYDFILNLTLCALKFLDGMTIFAHLHQAFSIASLDPNVLINTVLMPLGLLPFLRTVLDLPLIVKLAYTVEHTGCLLRLLL